MVWYFGGRVSVVFIVEIGNNCIFFYSGYFPVRCETRGDAKLLYGASHFPRK